MRSSEAVDWPFIGTWRLVSYESRDEAGGVQHPMGREVVGQLMYDAEGNMSALVARANVPPFASGDSCIGTDAEVRAAFDGFVAYFGTYSFNLSAGTVIHHVRGASFPNWTGTEQVRYFTAEGQRLVLSTPISVDSRHVTAILIWERVGAAH
jgi:lipocalin-like protein